MKKAPAQAVDELLKTATPPTRRRMAMDTVNPDLREAVVHFLDLKAKATPQVAHITFSWFYEAKLRPLYSGPCRSSVVYWIRNTLKRDHITGKPL